MMGVHNSASQGVLDARGWTDRKALYERVKIIDILVWKA